MMSQSVRVCRVCGDTATRFLISVISFFNTEKMNKIWKSGNLNYQIWINKNLNTK